MPGPSGRKVRARLLHVQVYPLRSGFSRLCEVVNDPCLALQRVEAHCASVREHVRIKFVVPGFIQPFFRLFCPALLHGDFAGGIFDHVVSNCEFDLGQFIHQRHAVDAFDGNRAGAAARPAMVRTLRPGFRRASGC